jgi:hypothetical protein
MGSIFWLNRPDSKFEFLGSDVFRAQISTTVTQTINVPDCNLVVLGINSMSGNISISNAPTIGTNTLSLLTFDSVNDALAAYDYRNNIPAGSYTLTVDNPNAANLQITVSYFKAPNGYSLANGALGRGTSNNPNVTIPNLTTGNDYLIVDVLTLRAYSGSTLVTPTSYGTIIQYGAINAVFGSGAQYSTITESGTSENVYYNTVNTFVWTHYAVAYNK